MWNTSDEIITAVPEKELDPEIHNVVDKAFTAPTDKEDG